MRTPLRVVVAAFLLLLIPALSSAPPAGAQVIEQYAPTGWHSAGQDLASTRDQFREQAISTANGDQLGNRTLRTSADLLSIDRNTGALEWIVQVESHPAAIITGSPVVYGGVIYVGVLGSVSVANGVLYAGSSSGFIHALDGNTGTSLWRFNSGGSVIDGPAITGGKFSGAPATAPWATTRSSPSPRRNPLPPARTTPSVTRAASVLFAIPSNR